MTAWVLIILALNGRGTAITSVDFPSKQSCEAAQMAAETAFVTETFGKKYTLTQSICVERRP